MKGFSPPSISFPLSTKFTPYTLFRHEALYLLRSHFTSKRVQLTKYRANNIESMDEVTVARKRLKVARDNHVEDLDREISALDERENGLKVRLRELNLKKHEIVQENGNRCRG
jgi:hypothetical protein